MNKKRLAGVVCACVSGFFTTLTNAALIDNGNGLIYDEDLNITWLADANYAATSGADPDGFMSWDEANAWAHGLEYAGHTEWRLPTAVACSGVSCAGDGSEMNHLFYNELGGTSGESILTTGDPDQLALFSGIQSSYWSAPERNADSAWIYYFDSSGLSGSQSWALKTGLVSAWAVHDGNISAVPLPAAVWLFGSGLLGLAGVARRRSC